MSRRQITVEKMCEEAPETITEPPDRCWKCRRKSSELLGWRICSDGPLRWICAACDLSLNKLALRWAYPKTWRRRLAKYMGGD